MDECIHMSSVAWEREQAAANAAAGRPRTYQLIEAAHFILEQEVIANVGRSCYRFIFVAHLTAGLLLHIGTNY